MSKPRTPAEIAQMERLILDSMPLGPELSSRQIAANIGPQVHAGSLRTPLNRLIQGGYVEQTQSNRGGARPYLYRKVKDFPVAANAHDHSRVRTVYVNGDPTPTGKPQADAMRVSLPREPWHIEEGRTA